LDAGGEVEEEWDVPGLTPVPAWPTALAVDSLGNLFVVDRHGGRVVVMDSRGRERGFGGRRGWTEGLLLFPTSIALIPDGRVAVADQGNGRVQVFSASFGEDSP
jgi:DNA-binding beta-propeller fold protein YncE